MIVRGKLYFGIACFLNYINFCTALNDGCSKFIHDKYGYPTTVSAYMAGSVYYLSMVLSPFLGFVIVSISSVREVLRVYLNLAVAYCFFHLLFVTTELEDYVCVSAKTFLSAKFIS